MRLGPKDRKDEAKAYDNSGQAFEADVAAIYGIDEDSEDEDDKNESSND